MAARIIPSFHLKSDPIEDVLLPYLAGEFKTISLAEIPKEVSLTDQTVHILSLIHI